MITIVEHRRETSLLLAGEIPATFDGRLRVNVANAMAAAAAALAMVEEILQRGAEAIDVSGLLERILAVAPPYAELRDTTMDQTKRTLLQVSVEQAALADEVCSILMGEDVEQRKTFIQNNAADVRFLDI